MISEPVFYGGANLSLAWADAFDQVMQSGRRCLTPLVVSITEFDGNQLPLEDVRIRTLLDEALAEHDTDLSVRTVAGTIFPDTFWRPGIPRRQLFDRYHRISPALRKYAGNRYGLYFQRLIEFPGAPAGGNQLETILGCYKKNVRRKTALQAAIFRPEEDLTEMPTRGFPCMQQLAFAPDSDTRTLSVSAFYASQYLFKRAYGNYLGLCHLGRFMAFEMGLRLSRVTCYVGFAQLDDSPRKQDLNPLAAAVRSHLRKLGQRSANRVRSA